MPVATVGPSTRSLPFFTSTFRPVRLTAPMKALPARSSVMSKPVAVTDVAPATETSPDCVTAPPAITVRASWVVTTPSSRAPESVIRIALVPELFAATGPVKSLPASVSVITPAPPLNVAVPAPDACVIAPVWVMPTAVTVSVPEPTPEAASWMASLSVIATLLAPELESVMVPWKSLSASVSVITPAPAVRVALPVTDTPAPSCVMPTAVTSSAPLAEIAPSAIELASVSVIPAPPVVVAETGPPKSLLD